VFVLTGLPVRAQLPLMPRPPAVPAGPALADDPLVRQWVAQALAGRPEVSQAQALVRAARERVSPATALPEPIVTAGLQNDGFRRLQIGRMESSYLSFMASQTFPWPGTRPLRATALRLAADQLDGDLDRVRRQVQADVEQACLDLWLALDQQAVLERFDALWAQAEGLARTRYETGDGAQSDLLRAQLERTRLQQRRLLTVAEVAQRRLALERALGAAPAPVDRPSRSLADLPDPVPADSAVALAQAERQSPELRQAQAALDRAGREVLLARRATRPDLTVTTAIMPRGTTFAPMWQVGLAAGLPLWAGRKQDREVVAALQLQQAAADQLATVHRVLAQRLAERRYVTVALTESNRLYRSSLLVQSEATVASTLVQYQVARLPFAAVLEALTGYLDDLTGFYASVATVQQLGVADRALSLDPVAGPGTGGMGAAATPRRSPMGSGSGGAGGAPAAGAGAGSAPRM
jgi:outer membrane protein TolC